MSISALLRAIALVFLPLFGFFAPAPAAAQDDLPPLNGPVFLTVSGLDPQRFAGGSAQFDLEGLASLGPVSFVTSSIWTDGANEFTGIPLAEIAATLGIPPDARILLRALNDYAVEMPLAEAEAEVPILAYHMNGKPMSVREKGPLWLVYPYDSDADKYQTETAYGRSVWQLDRIEVLQ